MFVSKRGLAKMAGAGPGANRAGPLGKTNACFHACPVGRRTRAGDRDTRRGADQSPCVAVIGLGFSGAATAMRLMRQPRGPVAASKPGRGRVSCRLRHWPRRLARSAWQRSSTAPARRRASAMPPRRRPARCWRHSGARQVARRRDGLGPVCRRSAPPARRGWPAAAVPALCRADAEGAVLGGGGGPRAAGACPIGGRTSGASLAGGHAGLTPRHRAPRLGHRGASEWVQAQCQQVEFARAGGQREAVARLHGAWLQHRQVGTAVTRFDISLEAFEKPSDMSIHLDWRRSNRRQRCRLPRGFHSR